MAKPCNVLCNQELSTIFNIYITYSSDPCVCLVKCEPPVSSKSGENSEISTYGEICKAISFEVIQSKVQEVSNLVPQTLSSRAHFLLWGGRLGEHIKTHWAVVHSSNHATYKWSGSAFP